MSNQDPSVIFSKFFQDTKFEDLPDNVIAEVKKQILDYIGVAIAGASKPGAEQVRLLNEANGGVEQATVWGSGKKLPVAYAGWVNSTMGHTLDMDDVHEDAVMHPGVVSIPTSLVMAEYVGGMTGKDLITSVALGSDMICRMSLAVYPGESKIPYGWHFTSLNSAMVSGNIAAKAMGMSLEEAVNTFGIAYHQTGGNGQPAKDGVLTKRLGPGFGVRNGITSALLAKMGVTGTPVAFEGEWGFINVYHRGPEKYSRDLLVGDLGKRWECANVEIKPYPCCRGGHHFVQLGLKMRNEMGVDPEQVEKIKIFTGPATVGLLGQPLSKKAFPPDTVTSQFSLSWDFCSALAMGKCGLVEFYEDERGIKNPKILALTSKIESLEGEEALALPGFDAARVEVYMKDGTVYNEFQARPNSMTYEDVLAKYDGCLQAADRPIPEANGKQLKEMIADLENVKDVREIVKLIRWTEAK